MVGAQYTSREACGTKCFLKIILKKFWTHLVHAFWKVLKFYLRFSLNKILKVCKTPWKDA
jgi:hypothetical protein